MGIPRLSEGDNTGRQITQQNIIVAGEATLALFIFRQMTRVIVSAVPALMTVNLTVDGVGKESQVGDRIELIFTAAAGSTITMGTGTAPTGTIVLTGVLQGSWTGVFDGVAFVETGLVAEAVVV